MIRELIEQEAAHWLQLGVAYPLRQIILERGRVHTPAPFKGRRGKVKQCFRNATMLAQVRPDLRYAEGLGLAAGLIDCRLLFEHAWCVDEEGRVVDPTWEQPELSHYMGIEFDIDVVTRRALATGTYGVLNNHVGCLDMDFICQLWPEYEGRDWIPKEAAQDAD